MIAAHKRQLFLDDPGRPPLSTIGTEAVAAMPGLTEGHTTGSTAEGDKILATVFDSVGVVIVPGGVKSLDDGPKLSFSALVPRRP